MCIQQPSFWFVKKVIIAFCELWLKNKKIKVKPKIMRTVGFRWPPFSELRVDETGESMSF